MFGPFVWLKLAEYPETDCSGPNIRSIAAENGQNLRRAPNHRNRAPASWSAAVLCRYGLCLDRLEFRDTVGTTVRKCARGEVACLRPSRPEKFSHHIFSVPP